MAEMDTIVLVNPTDDDFTQNYNGEPYTLQAKSSKSFTQFVGFHVAKHLATKMVADEFELESKNDPKLKKLNVVQLANFSNQRLTYDNPWLRICLYRILGDVHMVQECIMKYPYKGFVGEMSLYEKFVAAQTKVAEPKEKVKEPKE